MALLDFQSLKRRASPNDYLAAAAGMCPAARPDRELPDFPLKAAKLAEKVKAAFLAAPRVKLEETSPDGLAIRFTAVTALLRFTDDIDVRIVASGSSSSRLAIYSRSRVGYSDLGANRSRVEALLTALA